MASAPRFTHANTSQVPIYSIPSTSSANQGKQSAKKGKAPVTKVVPAVTADIASTSLRRIIMNELKLAGFDGTDQGALERLEREVTGRITALYRRAHDYSNLASRASPIMTDLLRACVDEQPSLLDMRMKRRRRRKSEKVTSKFLPPAESTPPPVLMSIDSDEDYIDAGNGPLTLHNIDFRVFPPLPPKHTYLKTPQSVQARPEVPSLAKKLQTAGLVQGSLQALLLATEESTNQKEAELFGHLVNYDATGGMYARKRWIVGGK